MSLKEQWEFSLQTMQETFDKYEDDILREIGSTIVEQIVVHS